MKNQMLPIHKRNELKLVLRKHRTCCTYYTKILNQPCSFIVLKELKETMNKELKKTRKTMYEQIENINKEIFQNKQTNKKKKKWNQTKILVITILITEMKNTLEDFSGRTKPSEKIIRQQHH